MEKTLRLPSLFLVAVLALGSVALVACGDDDEEEVIDIGRVEIIVPVDASTVGPVTGLDFEFSSAGGVHPDLSGDATTVTFTSTTQIRIASGGSTASGVVSLQPPTCVISVNSSSFSAGSGPQQGQTLNVRPCLLTFVDDNDSASLTAGSSTSSPNDNVDVDLVDRGGGNVGINVNGQSIGSGQLDDQGNLGGVTTNEGNPATGGT